MSIQKVTRKKEKAISEGNLEELYACCTELAVIYTNEDDFENALKEYKEAKTAAEAINNVINVAVAHRMIGQVYSSLQNYDLAIKHELKYLELARSKEDPVEEQRALATLGHTYLLKADTYTNPDSREKQDTLRKAKKYCLLSLQVCENLTHVNKKEQVEMQARLHLNLGLTIEQQNKPELAIEHLIKAIQLCKNMEIWEFLRRSYNVLASLYYHQSKLEQALDYCDKALNVAERLPDKKENICEVLLLKADVLFVLPNFQGAKQCLVKAYKLKTARCEEVEKKLRIVAAVSQFEEKLMNTPDCDLGSQKALYEFLGDGCVHMNSFSKALEYYHLMLETSLKMGDTGEQLRPCYVSLSQTYKDNKQYDQAIMYFKEELKLNSNNPFEACKTAISIAEVLEIKEADVESILSAYQEARSLAQTASCHKLECRVLSSMVQVLKDNDRLSEARKMEVDLENLKEKFGPLPSSSESEDEEENTPEIGADICIEELLGPEPESSPDKVKARRKCPKTKFRRNEKGEFPLHTASIAGNLTLVKKLLDQGHPVNVRDHSGWLPLHEACNHGYPEIVKELLDHGAWINDRGTEQNDGMTPLLDAACCGNLDVIKLLLDRGASPVMRTNKGETVLDCLVAWRKRYIKEEKRDLDQENLSCYENLVLILRTALTKAGHKPETSRRPLSRSPSPTFSSQQNSRKEHSRNEQKIRPGSSSRIIDVEDQSLRRSYSERDKVYNTCGSSLRRSMDSNDTCSSYTSTNATKEYEDAMKSLRRKTTALPSSSSPPETEGRSALISEEEVGDDWLVDDLITNSTRGVKRRRPHQFDNEPVRRPNRLTSPVRRNSFRPVSPVNSTSDYNDLEECQEHRDVAEHNDHLSEMIELLSPERPNHQNQNHPNQRHQNLTVTLPQQQTSISAFGIVHNTFNRQPEPLIPAVFQPPTPSQPMQTNYLPSSQFPTGAQVAPPSIKVRVEGKLLLIPLPTSADEPLTIAWLVQEAAKRYYSFEGVEPKLSLRTEDGAMLAPQDPVTLLLPYREVEGVVVSWKMHPITERYREACSDLVLEADEYLEKSLDISQASFSLNLKGCSLDAPVLEPVFRASTHTTNLQHLILSDNRLGDAGMQLLSKLIIKLPHLRELDLTCNGITYEGFNIFVHQIIDHQACKRLEVLKLSNNRLGSSCVTLFGRLFDVTKSLTSLSVASVGITSASFVGLNTVTLSFENLEKIDMGYNEMGREGVQALLRHLTASQVVSLTLTHAGYCGVVQVVADWITRGDPCRLQILDLAYCTDQESAFTSLIRCLEKAPLLEHLELSCIEEIDEKMLQSLYQLPLRVLRLPGVRVKSFSPLKPPIHELSCLSLNPHPPTWAFQGPFGLLTNNTCPSS